MCPICKLAKLAALPKFLLTQNRNCGLSDRNSPSEAEERGIPHRDTLQQELELTARHRSSPVPVRSKNKIGIEAPQ